MGRGGAALAAVVLLGACGGEELESAVGEIELFPRELDFGAVWVGERVEGTLVLGNDGRAAATVGLRSSGPPFEVPSAVEVPGAGEVAVKVGFRPLGGGAVTGEVTVQVEGADEGLRTAVRGEGVSPRISHPGQVDFGAVRVGERAVLPVGLGNDTSRDMVDLRVSISGADAAYFTVVGGSRELGAQTTGELSVAFEPALVRSYRAVLSVSACEGCQQAGIELVGRGGESEILVLPAVLDFGSVVAGGNRERPLTIRPRSPGAERGRGVADRGGLCGRGAGPGGGHPGAGRHGSGVGRAARPASGGGGERFLRGRGVPIPPADRCGEPGTHVVRGRG